MASPLHSRLPPSKSEIWSVCLASIPFIEANAAILPADGGVYADEGTTAHAVAAHYLGKSPMPVEANPEMLGYAKDYAEFVLDKKGPNDRLIIERRVPLFYFPEQHGTVDAAVLSDKSIYIADFKYGAGTPVYAKENKQLASYAESLLRELEELQDIPDDFLVTLVIYQPRDRNDSEPVRIWAISRKDLREFCAPINEAAQIIRMKDAKRMPFVAGKHCDKGFCRARGICKAYANQGLEAIPGASLEKIETLVLPDPTGLPRDLRIKVIAARKTLEAWLEAVENQEVTELMAGAPRMGMKLVEGKTNRQWTDETEADKLLANHLSAEERRKPWEVISIAQAEKKLKGKDLSTKFTNRMAELTTRPEGKPSLVPESDKRPPLVFNLTEGLEKVPADDGVL